MVGQEIMASTLAALADNCRLILLGDRNQLSSVEAGSVLGDITGHGQPLTLSPQRSKELQALSGEKPAREVKADSPAIADCIAELEYSYRFAESGGIGKLAQAIKQGDSTAIEALLGKPDQEISWIDAEGNEPPKRIIDLALDNYRAIFKAKTASEALAEFNKSRILTARADGPWGETGIRERLESAMRQEKIIRANASELYKGQPIIIRRNDHNDTGLSNGDTGILWPDSDSNKKQLFAWFEINGELKSFSPHQLSDWQTAWTLTVHRSQGSEYEKVLLVLPAIESRVVSRELIYTGITRAIRHCTVLMMPSQFLQNTRLKYHRTSGLYKRLGWQTEDNQ